MRLCQYWVCVIAFFLLISSSRYSLCCLRLLFHFISSPQKPSQDSTDFDLLCTMLDIQKDKDGEEEEEETEDEEEEEEAEHEQVKAQVVWNALCVYTTLCTQVSYPVFMEKIGHVTVFLFSSQVLYCLSLTPIAKEHGIRFRAKWSTCSIRGPEDVIREMNKVAMHIDNHLGDISVEGTNGVAYPLADIEAMWRGM